MQAGIERLKTFRASKGTKGYVGVASVMLNVLALALPLALLQIYDRIIPNSSTGTLLILMAGVASAVILEALLRVARTEIVGWAGVKFEHNAGCEAFGRIMATPADELERIGAGELIERLAGLPTVREVFSEQWALILCDLPFVFLFLGAIAYVAGWLVLAPVVMLAGFVAFAYVSTRSVGKSITDFNTVRDRRQNFNIEVIHGIHAVKSMAMEGQMIQRYARLQESVARANHMVVQGNSKALAVGQAFSQLLTLVVVVGGGWLVVRGHLTVGGLSACTLLAGRALQPVQKAVAMWTRFQTARLMRERLASLMELPGEPRSDKVPSLKLKGAITLRDVSFGHGEDGDDLFQGLSLDIRPGERVAIAGDNGSGKSTLLRLILGVTQPNSGEVLIDGQPVTSYDPEALRSGAIAYVPQYSELFRGTILDNLTMFRPHLRKSALAIAKDLGLDEVVYRLPGGYDTRIGDGSAEALPRGVIQRIAVVRALAPRPGIVLFDEANASMDGPGDEQLRRYLENLDRHCTMILVTLRPSLQKLGDRLLLLKGGRLEPKAPNPAAPTPYPGESSAAPLRRAAE
ncbi:peptidase domain-containing ABC transporter [Magnetospirillum aberrantis]|uniref:ATP-binding cassette domain-containing protein n=1 Tax=Magnetospirillum aberrantis SpK TaxID=908842 RepID=A0A7C9QRT7_9PROT|nr:ABC transporter transmembrane domain-containing protein [Magnetospirillum aberrantis]NFV78619.1 ATP-binding cassette domain-containing protein [Magnetospirillum aberrantis SpK]